MPLFVAVSTLSAAVLGYEILVMRLFSIIQWHHFAYMVISLALLGYGAAGTFLAFAKDWLDRRFELAFSAGAGLFAVSSIGCFALAQLIPFNPFEIGWDARQQLYLLALYLLLALPFFFAASSIGLAFTHFRDRIGRVYRFDLTGAGLGAFGIVLILFALAPEDALRLVGALGVGAAALAGLSQVSRRTVLRAGAVLLAGLALMLLWPGGSITPRLSEYKGLSLALQVPGSQVLVERSSPLGQLAVVESPVIPFRHAPGLSLNNRQEPPAQLGLFTDGDSLQAITRFEGELSRIGYLDYQTGALPYHLIERPSVLILGAGAGAEVLLAKYHRAAPIDAVELNPQVIALLREDFGSFAGHLYDSPEVRVHIAEARGFVSASRESYDLIQIALLDSFGAAAAGLHALNASTLYTVEAFEAFLERLSSGGLIAVTHWLKLPPRDSFKLFATALTALERQGVAQPEARLALIRGWKTATLLIKNGAFSAAEIAAIREFCDERWFDLAYYPGIEAEEANRYNLLDEPTLYSGAKALIGEGRRAFLDEYKYALYPATDNRPYFAHFFKWRVLPELLALRARGGLPLVEWGYVVLVSTLALAALASALLILLPLRMLKKRVRARGTAAGNLSFGRVALYFLALGLAFLFIEIAFIQRFTLFLSHPLYAIAVVLAGFLLFAGLGSGVSARIARRFDQAQGEGRPWFGGPLAPISLAVTGILLTALVYLFALPPLFDWLMPLPVPAKIVLSLALIAPLAFAMGMPFPLGLSRVAGEAPDLVPWAFGINGCASVISAVLATLLAIHFGFTVVVGSALALYLFAATVFGRPVAQAHF